MIDLAELHRERQSRRQQRRRSSNSSLASTADFAAHCGGGTTRPRISAQVEAKLAELGVPLARLREVEECLGEQTPTTLEELLELLLADESTELGQGRVGQVADSPGASRVNPDVLAQLCEMGFDIETIYNAAVQVAPEEEGTIDILLPILLSGEPPAQDVGHISSSSRQVDASMEGGELSAEMQLLAMGFSAARVRSTMEQVGRDGDLEVFLESLVGSSEVDVEAEGSTPESAQPGLVHNLSRDSRAVLEGADGDHRVVLRILVSIKAALTQGLVTMDDRAALHSYILHGDIDTVSRILDGINLQKGPDMPLSIGEQDWECVICFNVQETIGWTCPFDHRFCATCLRQHADTQVFPLCPQVGCSYAFEEADFRFLAMDEERLEAFRRERLRVAIDTCANADGEQLLRCPQPDCGNVVVVPPGKGRMRFDCQCGATAFCTMCRQSPYHYHAECSRVQELRNHWLAWLEASARHSEALRDEVRAHDELVQDEKWKEQHCRLCPGCSRPISRIEGCADMVCGRSYHGGDHQPGCGRQFNWNGAKRYTAVVGQRRAAPDSNRKIRERGRNTVHPFANCSICKKRCIQGLRFRCIHCECFNACEQCEGRLLDEHTTGHVFEIMAENGVLWQYLPAGTRVRLVRSEGHLPRSWNRRQQRAKAKAREDGRALRVPSHVKPVIQPSTLEGARGTIIGLWQPPPHGYRIQLENGRMVELPSEHVDPCSRHWRRLLQQCKAEEQSSQQRLLPVPQPPPRGLLEKSETIEF